MVKSILVVDDDKEIRDSTRMVLESMGYKVSEAPDGKSAIDALKKAKFDLVLLDIIMPKMSGRAVLEKIRKDPKLKSQKVALLTVVRLSHPGKEIIAKLKPEEYFQKPIADLKGFKGKVRKILGED